MQFDKLNSVIRALTVDCEELRTANATMAAECLRLTNVILQVENRLAATAEQRRLERQQRHSIEQEYHDVLQCNAELRTVIVKLQSTSENDTLFPVLQDHFVSTSETDESMFVMV